MNAAERKIRIAQRITEEEAQEIKGQAEASHLTLSEYARRRILGKRVVSQADMNMLAELRRLGGLLKHIHNETRGTYSELTANAIRTLESYAKTLELAHRKKNSEDGGINSS
jgi:hypothetical protein